jgi:ATP-dependent Lon protease
MEVIRIPGYTEDEKLGIAQRYLLAKQLKANGLKPEELRVEEEALRDIVRYYTRESGVRNLEREISKICRKVVKELTLGEVTKAKKAKSTSAKSTKKAAVGVEVTSANLDHYLGVRRFDFGRKEIQNEIGLVTGLAWTQVGGELLSIEASIVPGKGRLVNTGQLGDVMKESIQAALSVVRARVDQLGIDPEFHQKLDVHIHVPEGATPKDGPSAGVAMCTALVSALTKVPVRSEVAMTGEITLRGRVLPIGGLKEKLLAALRGGITTVIIPECRPTSPRRWISIRCVGSTRCSTSRWSVRCNPVRRPIWKRLTRPRRARRWMRPRRSIRGHIESSAGPRDWRWAPRHGGGRMLNRHRPPFAFRVVSCAVFPRKRLP